MYVRRNGDVYVSLSERRTKKEGRWRGLLQPGFGGGIRESESPRQAFNRELHEELPFIKSSHVRRVVSFIGVPSYVSRADLEIGGKRVLPEHVGTEFNINAYLLELQHGAVEKFGGTFENDITTALEKVRQAPSASSSNELSFPVFVPLREVERLAKEQPQLIVPHYLSVVEVLRQHLDKEKRIVSVLDVDRTLTGPGFFIESFAEHLTNKGLFKPNKLAELRDAIKSVKENKTTYEIGATRAIKCWAAGLKGQNVKKVEAEGRRFAQKVLSKRGALNLRIYPFSQELLRVLNRRGKTILVSGSPIEVIAPFAKTVGAHHAIGVWVKKRRGIYTGELRSNMITEKEKAVAGLLQRKRLTGHEVFVFGDSHTDMMERASRNFLLTAKPALCAMASEKGWVVPIRGESQGIPDLDLPKIKQILSRS
ncbi:MAG: haloacid dehalogenase-like hydrolase [Candidatus Micrarchaeota archaeon]